MNFTHILKKYELQAARADDAFEKMQESYGTYVKCLPGCSDCCHAIFGLFLVEAVYLQIHFSQLERRKRRPAILRADKMERNFEKLEKKFHKQNSCTQLSNELIARERIRCPLLDDTQKCILYHYRPITCRVYGIPTVVQGKAHVCGISGFKKGEPYPAFDLGEVQRELYKLTRELLDGNAEKASLLISVSKAIKTPVEAIISGRPVESGASC
ncbi:MAG TPA: hypothetical protein DDW42_09635 [Desulfobacteraceae bacterium]|nr:hypothetical protein [Desulfobacteraceae bacterium]